MKTVNIKSRPSRFFITLHTSEKVRFIAALTVLFFVFGPVSIGAAYNGGEPTGGQPDQEYYDQFVSYDETEVDTGASYEGMPGYEGPPGAAEAEVEPGITTVVAEKAKITSVTAEDLAAIEKEAIDNALKTGLEERLTRKDIGATYVNSIAINFNEDTGLWEGTFLATLKGKGKSAIGNVSCELGLKEDGSVHLISFTAEVQELKKNAPTGNAGVTDELIDMPDKYSVVHQEFDEDNRVVVDSKRDYKAANKYKEIRNEYGYNEEGNVSWHAEQKITANPGSIKDKKVVEAFDKDGSLIDKYTLEVKDTLDKKTGLVKKRTITERMGPEVKKRVEDFSASPVARSGLELPTALQSSVIAGVIVTTSAGTVTATGGSVAGVEPGAQVAVAPGDQAKVDALTDAMNRAQAQMDSLWCYERWGGADDHIQAEIEEYEFQLSLIEGTPEWRAYQEEQMRKEKEGEVEEVAPEPGGDWTQCPKDLVDGIPLSNPAAKWKYKSDDQGNPTKVEIDEDGDGTPDRTFDINDPAIQPYIS